VTGKITARISHELIHAIDDAIDSEETEYESRADVIEAGVPLLDDIDY